MLCFNYLSKNIFIYRLFRKFIFLILLAAVSCSTTKLKIPAENEPNKTKIECYPNQYFNSPLEAFRSLCTETSPDSKLNAEELLLKKALEQIKDHKFDKAEKVILNLHKLTKVDSLRKIYQMIYYDLLFIQSKWNELCIFDSLQNKNIEDADNIMVIAQAFRLSPPEIIKWTQDSSELEFTRSPTGCPIVACTINGNLKYFWFDTGANYSVLSAKTADECDVRPPIKQYSKALTGTSRKIDIYPATINELKIGNLIINHSPAVIVHDFDLQMNFFGSYRSTKIDGIIGWKAIQNMSVKVDFKNHTLTIKEPAKIDDSKSNSSNRNFFWLGCPLIKAFTNTGDPLIMALDLGSEKTSITQNIFSKISFEKIYQQIQPVTSAGGSVYFNSNKVSVLTCIIDGKKYDFYNIGTTFQIPPYFVNLDGIIGMDLFEESIIAFDIKNGYFHIIKN